MFRNITVIYSVLTTLIIGMAIGLFGMNEALAGSPTATQVNLTNLTKPLVPTKVLRGDREFGGNGPNIISRVNLQVSADRRSIGANVYFKATETKSDWSTTEGNWSLIVYTAPKGKLIDSILSPTSSEVRFRSEPAGFQILGPGEDFKQFLADLEKLAKQVIAAVNAVSDGAANTSEVKTAQDYLNQVNSGLKDVEFQGNHVHNQIPKSGPVALFAIVGDTGGDDISTDNNPKDDTRIQAIAFKPINIRFQ